MCKWTTEDFAIVRDGSVTATIMLLDDMEHNHNRFNNLRVAEAFRLGDIVPLVAGIERDARRVDPYLSTHDTKQL